MRQQRTREHPPAGTVVRASWLRADDLIVDDGLVSASMERFVRGLFEADDEVVVIISGQDRGRAGYLTRVPAAELVTAAGQAWVLDAAEHGHRVGVLVNGSTPPARLLGLQVPGVRAAGWWGAAPVPTAVIRIPRGPTFAVWTLTGGSVAVAQAVAKRVSTQIGVPIAADLVVPLPGLAWPGNDGPVIIESVSLQPAGGYVPIQFEAEYAPMRWWGTSARGSAREREVAFNWACRELLLGRRWNDVVRVLRWRYPAWPPDGAERLVVRSQRSLRKIGALPRQGGRHVESRVVRGDRAGTVGRTQVEAGLAHLDDADGTPPGAAAGARDSVD